MKQMLAALVFLVLMLAVLSREVSLYPGQPLSQRLAGEFQSLGRLR